MKFSAKAFRFVLIGAIILIAVFMWPSYRPIPISAPKPTVPAVSPRPAPAITFEPPPAATPAIGPQQSARVEPTPASDDLLAKVHSLFRQWLEAQTGDHDAQDAAIRDFQAVLTADNAAEIVRSLSPEELACPLGSAALDRWLQTGLLTAANWLAANTNATQEQALLVGRNMFAAPAGSQMLANYSDQLASGPWKQQFLEGAGQLALETNPAAAIDLARRMDPGQDQSSLLQTVTYSWVSRDPNAALDWMLAVQDPSLREKLVAVGAQAYAATDPALAASWVSSAIKTDQTLNDAVLHVADAWVAKKPADAAQWVASLPDGSLRDDALYAVARQWLQTDQRDNGPASAWIMNLPDADKNKILIKLGAVDKPPVETPDP